ncbi:MAG: ImmA/IrrE family metallo-endopeptidase [Thermoguttaceae bacterium]|nr:ImmA/IrrE family metallo-endopeptidase [Thermoguttaceae bacterium]
MWGQLDWQEYVQVLDSVVAESLQAAKVSQPPVDPCRIARALGLRVVWDGGLAERGRYVRLRQQGGHHPVPTMILQRHPRAERCYWAAAHELGEHLVYQVAEQLGLRVEEDWGVWRERMANHLAARILLPTAWFSQDGQRLDWDLRALKQRYSTASHEAIARRMLEMEEPVIISIFDHGQLRWRRANRPGRVPPLSQVESLCWQTAHQENQDHQEFSEHLRIRAWAVHEPGWRREILRTERW